MSKEKDGINLRFVLRGLAFAVPAAVLLSLVGFLIVLLGTPLTRPIEPTPVPPAITAPHGEIPSSPVALSEFAQYQGREYQQAGSGFLLRLADNTQIGVTTAHSLGLDDPKRNLERVAFRIPARPGNVAECTTLYGPPGYAMDGTDLSVDFVLLRVDGPVDPALLLSPDPRGGPQPGERVSLFSGVGNPPVERYELAGTVVSTDERVAWVLMDKESFNPGMMSGSPVLSHHTGQVVGMAVAASPRLTRLYPTRYRILIGLNPIGSIVDKAQIADSFPAFHEYQRE